MNFLKDMDPITMTLILLGIANTMNKTNTNTNLPVTGLGNRYQDEVPSSELLEVIKLFESGSVTYSRAYVDSVGRVTIGNGSTYVVHKNLKYLRPVKIGDTLQSLKTLCGYSNISDDDFAKQLTYNHLMCSQLARPTYLKHAKVLDNLGVLYDKSTAQMLIEITYGSGKIGLYPSDRYYQNFLNNLRASLGSSLKIKSALLQYRLEYYMKQTNAWKINYKGWTTRMFTIAKFYAGFINFSQLKFQKELYEKNYNQKRIDASTLFGIKTLF